MQNDIQMNEMRRNDDAFTTNAGTKKISGQPILLIVTQKILSK